jgi:hypothetical protein
VPRAESLSVNLEAPFERVWEFISDPRTLHLWTVDFAIEPPKLKSDGLYVIQTPHGPLELFIRANKESGVVDFYFGSDGRFRITPSRLLRNGEDACVYVFTQFEPPNAPAGVFERLVQNVRKELEILAERFRR